jgi:hypothetical protein
MKRSEAFPSAYLNRDDCTAPIRAIIKSVALEPVKDQDTGGSSEKPVAHFASGVKPLILNVVNWATLEDCLGVDSDEWAGKQIELWLDPSVTFGGKRVGGVRIRIPQPGQEPSALLTFDAAIDACDEVGIGRQALVDYLKSQGLAAYNVASCTPLVRALIAAKQVRETMAGAPEVSADIPF